MTSSLRRKRRITAVPITTARMAASLLGLGLFLAGARGQAPDAPRSPYWSQGGNLPAPANPASPFAMPPQPPVPPPPEWKDPPPPGQGTVETTLHLTKPAGTALPPPPAVQAPPPVPPAPAPTVEISLTKPAGAPSQPVPTPPP